MSNGRLKNNLQNLMNQINPRKLMSSKWTAVEPVNQQKHFIVVAVKFSQHGQINYCEIEALLTKKTTVIDWKTLKDSDQWLPGWQ